MTEGLLKLSTKKKDSCLEQGSELVGFIVKRNDSFQVIADGRVRNISKADFRALMQYPDDKEINMSKRRDIAVIAIKNKEVLLAKVFSLSELPSVITNMELDGVERVLFTYLDGLTLNTVLPATEAGRISIIQSINSEFEFHEYRQKNVSRGIDDYT
jgi:hypothetical protein